MKFLKTFQFTFFLNKSAILSAASFLCENHISDSSVCYFWRCFTLLSIQEEIFHITYGITSSKVFYGSTDQSKKYVDGSADERNEYSINVIDRLNPDSPPRVLKTLGAPGMNDWLGLEFLQSYKNCRQNMR